MIWLLSIEILLLIALNGCFALHADDIHQHDWDALKPTKLGEWLCALTPPNPSQRLLPRLLPAANFDAVFC